MSDFSDELKSYASQHVDKIGIASADSFANAPRGQKPRDHLPNCKSVVAFCMKHLSVFSRSANKSCQAYSQDIVNHATTHEAYRISRFIEKRGYAAFPMVASVQMWPFEEDWSPVGRDQCEPQGRISLRHAAELAGIGRIGRIGIVLTPEFGPRVQLGAILTDADLRPDEPMSDSLCTGCDACIEICPAGAISLPEDANAYEPVDRESCLSYRREFGAESPLGLKNACSLCRAVCPVGQ